MEVVKMKATTVLRVAVAVAVLFALTIGGSGGAVVAQSQGDDCPNGIAKNQPPANDDDKQDDKKKWQDKCNGVNKDKKKN